jgi:hypothetical protein
VRADREFSPEIAIGEMVGGENDGEGKKPRAKASVRVVSSRAGSDFMRRGRLADARMMRNAAVRRQGKRGVIGSEEDEERGCMRSAMASS